MNFQRLAVSLFALSLVPAVLSAESKPLELKWTELAPMVVSHAVELSLSDGGTVRGEAIAIREDMLVLDVKQSSGAKAYGKGNAQIPRGAITLIKLTRNRGTWGRTLGTTVGLLAGLGAGGFTAAHTRTGGAAVATVVGVASGAAVGGYYAGRKLDRRTTRIVVVP